jgi:hypothetical protein
MRCKIQTPSAPEKSIYQLLNNLQISCPHRHMFAIQNSANEVIVGSFVLTPNEFGMYELALSHDFQHINFMVDPKNLQAKTTYELAAELVAKHGSLFNNTVARWLMYPKTHPTHYDALRRVA